MGAGMVMMQSDALYGVKRADRQLKSARKSLDTAVRAARKSGCSWRTIADTLGVRVQSCHERFRHVDDG